VLHLFQLATSFSYFGESLALGSALAWAFAVIFFRISGKTVHPLGLNLYRNILACILVVLTMLVFGMPILAKIPVRTYGLMLLSGVLGITLSDTLFFASLNRLGAGLSAIVDCLYSPSIIALSFLFLGERMSAIQLLGVAFIISAVLSISQKKHEASIPHRDFYLGIMLGILAMFTMAVGIVMIKPLLKEVPLLWALLMRLLGAIFSLGIILLFHPRRRLLLSPLLSLQNWKSMVPGSILGSYIGLTFWMAGMKYTFASIAAALSQLSTIFIFILGSIFLKEKVTPRRIAAIILAFVGAFLASLR
jgi:drug/metabolite transporter (DMT)-like permease